MKRPFSEVIRVIDDLNAKITELETVRNEIRYEYQKENGLTADQFHLRFLVAKDEINKNKKKETA